MKRGGASVCGTSDDWDVAASEELSAGDACVAGQQPEALSGLGRDGIGMRERTAREEALRREMAAAADCGGGG